MTNRREFIRTLSLAPLGVGVDFADAAVGEKKGIIREAIEQIMTDTPRETYLPGPTRLKRIGKHIIPEPMSVKLEKEGAGISKLFAGARDFFRKEYKGTDFEQKREAIEKQNPGYQIIPYMIARRDEVLSEGNRLESRILHLARRKNPKPTGSDNSLLEWYGPIEEGFDVDIMGVAGKAENYESLSRVKSLGAGTNFDIYDQEGNQYVVLATAYPPFGEKNPNIQTPFSEGLEHPKILAQGKLYFESLQGKLVQLLEEVDWGKVLREFDGYKIIQGLILTENMSMAPSGMNESEAKQFYARELRKVYALLGVNQSEAFQRKSSAGAKGLVQFTENAWEGRVDDKGNKTGIRYHFPFPGFTKNPDFLSMIRSHELSLLAACAHIVRQYGDYLKHPKAGESFHSLDLPYKHILIAAGYNSNNSKRIGDFLRATNQGRNGLAGIVDRFYRILTNSGAEETRVYMKKFIFSLRSLGYFIPEVSFTRLSSYSLPE